MRSREAALAALDHLLTRAAADQDLSGVLTEEALKDAEELAATTDPVGDSKAAYVLGMFHWFRHLALPDGADRDDLDAAVRLLAPVFRADPEVVPVPLHRLYQQAHGHSGENDPDPGALLSRAGERFIAYQRTGELHPLTEAVALFRAAVAATPAGHPGRAVVLSDLGAALRTLYERTGDIEVLAEAVQVGRGAAATPADHSVRATALSNLGGTLLALYGSTGDIEVLAEAVQVSRGAVAADPADHSRRGWRLNSLSNALRTLYERMGDTEVLVDAVQIGRDAVAATPIGHPVRSAALNNLGGALQWLARRTGDTEVLTEAVQVGRDAVAATPVRHPDRATTLNNLGNGLRMLYERTGDSEVLTEGVQVGRDAVAATPLGHPDYALHLHTLGISLQALAERTGDIAVLAEAVQVGRDAVAATPVGHRDRSSALNSLGAALQALYERTGETTALAEAVQARKDAVAATPAGHPDRAAHLNNLGNVLRMMSRHTRDSTALAEAVHVGRAATTATPVGDPDRAGRLFNLGLALHALYEHTQETPILAEEGLCFAQAAKNEGAPTTVRIAAYRALADLPDDKARSPQGALAAVEAAVGLLPQVASRILVRADREYGLGRLASLAGQAAAAAVAAGRPGRAVELLEQSRGVLVADTLDARSSDLARLRKYQPDLADAFDELRSRIDALDHMDAFASQPIPTAGLAKARRDAHADWDGLVTRIQAIDDFEKFLQPPDIHQLAFHAQDGPVVFIYTSPSRCDALILTDDPGTPVRLVPLTDLTEKDAHRQTGRLLTARLVAGDTSADPAARIAAQTEILDVLAWLWDTLTEPVIAALGHTNTPADGQPWPRVWWCPIGILAYLPLHAAGHHHDLAAGRAHPRTVLDRVVSTYTTTLRGLAYSRAQYPDPAADTTLIIAVPDAPGAPPLPGVIAEASAVADLIPGAQVLPHPTRDTVLAALPDYPVVHFACHGYADWADPAASQLILYDYQDRPLTVADISALHITGGLAFLSACDTTVTSLALANEAVHITGAFHLAGYQHVIGTLWPVDDTTASKLAQDFYTGLIHHCATTADTSRAADALHHATRRLRDKFPATPSLWAAHTHTGA